MAPTIIVLLIASLFTPSYSNLPSADQSFTSLLISDKGLDFVKDLLILKAVSSLTPLQLPPIQRSVKIPFVGNAHVVFSNITIYKINVSTSYVKPGDSGIVIVTSGATCNLSMNWNYSYATWIVPVEISDKGRASVQVEGLEVGLTLGLENRQGTLKLSLMECGCYVKNISIKLDGGASWLYQGYLAPVFFLTVCPSVCSIHFSSRRF